jgi:hypothetical protein
MTASFIPVGIAASVSEGVNAGKVVKVEVMAPTPIPFRKPRRETFREESFLFARSDDSFSFFVINPLLLLFSEPKVIEFSSYGKDVFAFLSLTPPNHNPARQGMRLFNDPRPEFLSKG